MDARVMSGGCRSTAGATEISKASQSMHRIAASSSIGPGSSLSDIRSWGLLHHLLQLISEMYCDKSTCLPEAGVCASNRAPISLWGVETQIISWDICIVERGGD